jgi:Arc/MetJ-type ribon-helix-helix transcriptional regulator
MSTRTISLPQQLADSLAARVASGEYASEGDLIREGLLALDAAEGAIAEWVSGKGAARYDTYKAEPSRVRGADEAFTDIQKRIAAAAKL